MNLSDILWKLAGLVGIQKEKTYNIYADDYKPPSQSTPQPVQPTIQPTQTPQQPQVAQQYAPQNTQTKAGSYGQRARNPNYEKFNPDRSIVDAINQAASQYQIPPELLFDIALQESGFNPSSRSEQSTAKGLFQFTDPTWQTAQNYAGTEGSSLQWPENASPLNPEHAALVAAYLIKMGQLGRWDASKGVWGQYYKPEELEPFYAQSGR